MKVIFNTDVPGVGRKDDVKEVSAGYARNFLFLKNLARPATEGAVKTIELEKEKRTEDIARMHAIYKNMVGKLKSMGLRFTASAGEKGKTFGTITAADIAKELKNQGYAIEKDWIHTPPIKTLGEHLVTITLPGDFKAELKIAIEAK